MCAYSLEKRIPGFSREAEKQKHEEKNVEGMAIRDFQDWNVDCISAKKMMRLDAEL